MGCSCVGFCAVVLSIIAAFSFDASFVMPLWSGEIHVKESKDTAPGNFFLHTGVTAGIWGLCIDTTATKESFNLNQCYYYFTSKQARFYEHRGTNDANITIKFEKKSLCEYHSSGESLPNGIDKEFLDNTCGTLGKATLAASVLAIMFGGLQVLFILLGISCCKKNSSFVYFALALSHAALFSIAVALILWFHQSRPLHEYSKAVKFQVSFYLAICAVLAYILTIVFGRCHITKGNLSESRTSNDHVNSSLLNKQGTNLV